MTDNTTETQHRLVPYHWKPGESGNPNGRPKGAKTGPRAKLKQWMEKATPPEILKKYEKYGLSFSDDATNADVVIEVLGIKAFKGEDFALKLLFDQLESTLPKKVTVEGNPDRPIMVNVQPVKSLTPDEGYGAKIKRT